MQVVPTVGTPHTMAELMTLIGQAFTAIGHPITPAQCVNLTVLAAIETGRGKSMKNNNLGNISASPRYQGLAWRPPWFDPAPDAPARMKSLHEAMLKGTAPSAFRAYTSPLAGAEDFARQLVHTFPEVLDAAKQTDANILRLALGQKYSRDYLANPKVTDTIRSLQKELGLVVSAVTSGSYGVIVGALLYIAYRLFIKR